jgi:hypothetical protein
MTRSGEFENVKDQNVSCELRLGEMEKEGARWRSRGAVEGPWMGKMEVDEENEA